MAKKRKGNINALIRWVGKVGWYQCTKSLAGKKGISNPKLVCGFLKGRAKKKGVLSKSHRYGKRKR